MSNTEYQKVLSARKLRYTLFGFLVGALLGIAIIVANYPLSIGPMVVIVAFLGGLTGTSGWLIETFM